MTRGISVVAVVVVGLLVASCGDDGRAPLGGPGAVDTTVTRSPEATSTTAAPRAPVFARLCAVLDAALGGQMKAAKAVFDHGPLHTLADAVIDIDRGVAARLLEAKEAVESDLAAPAPDAATVVADLEELIAATADALVATGTPAPPTCDSETP